MENRKMDADAVTEGIFNFLSTMIIGGSIVALIITFLSSIPTIAAVGILLAIGGTMLVMLIEKISKMIR